MVEARFNNSDFLCNWTIVQVSVACVQKYSDTICCFPDLSETFINFAVPYLLTISAFGGIGNFLCLFVLPYARRQCKDPYNPLRGITTILLLNLNLSSCLYCTFVLPLAALTYIRGGWIYGETSCQLLAFLRCSLGLLLWNTLATIILCRALMLWNKSLHRRLFLKCHGLQAILGIWIFSFLPFSLLYLEDQGTFGYSPKAGQCILLQSSAWIRINLYVGLAFLTSWTVMVTSLIFIVVKLKLSQKEISTIPELGSTTKAQLVVREQRLLILFLFLAGSFTVSAMPYVVMYLSFWDTSEKPSVYPYVHLIAILHNVFDFFSYVLRVGAYRDAFVLCFNDFVAWWRTTCICK